MIVFICQLIIIVENIAVKHKIGLIYVQILIVNNVQWCISLPKMIHVFCIVRL